MSTTREEARATAAYEARHDGEWRCDGCREWWPLELMDCPNGCEEASCDTI